MEFGEIIEIIVPVVAILAIFGIGGHITLKIIQLIRDWLIGDKNQSADPHLLRKVEQYELQQQQIIKRLQNLETLMLDSEQEGRSLAEGHDFEKQPFAQDMQHEERPLKNKLRS